LEKRILTLYEIRETFMMRSIKKLGGIVVIPLILLSCSSSNSGDATIARELRLGTFAYSYTVSSSSETIALSDDPAPDTGLTFSSFANSVINQNGASAFYALAKAPNSIVDSDGLWFRDANGVVSLIAIRDGAIANSNGLLFNDISKRFKLNNSGQVLFLSSLAGTNVNAGNQFALFFRDITGNISPIARSGDIAPGWFAPYDYSFTDYDLNDLGEVVFTAEVNLGPDSSVDGDLILPGVWLRNGDGSVVPILSSGDNAPGTGSTFFTFNRVQINNNSQILVEARASIYWRHGVWTVGPNGLPSVVAYEEDPAPGIAGVTLGKTSTNSTPLMNAQINNNNEIALFSIIDGASVNTTNDHAIWLRDGAGIFQLVMREGDMAPQQNADVSVAALMGSDSEVTLGRPQLNNAGQLLLSAQLSGPSIDASNDKVLWLWDKSTFHKVVQSGDTINGLASGESVASFSLSGDSMQLNDNGEVLLQVTLAGPGVDTSNDQALVYYNATSGANIFLREGDSMQVASGDNRIVTDYLLEGRPGMNNSSQVLFAAGFGNSYGLFLTTPYISGPTPPAPSNDSACSSHEDEDDDDEHEIEYDDNGLEIESEHHEEHEACEVEDEDKHSEDHHSGDDASHSLEHDTTTKS